MEIIWEITANDVQIVKEAVNNNRNVFWKIRRERNVNRENLQINGDTIIRTLLMCLLTSQQRSGPDSPVSKFLQKDNFPINYKTVSQVENIEIFVKKVLERNGLTRFINRNSRFFATGIRKFQENQWTIIPRLKELIEIDSKMIERKMADKLDDELDGIGPKQARNFLQALGLTRYEIPIDSRIINWLKEFNFPVPLSSSPLGNVGYYHFVLDGVQELCKKAEIYPCLFDAAIFSSFDNGGWIDKEFVF